MASTEEKCKSLQERLNLLSRDVSQQPQKQKISQIEEFMKRITQKFVEGTISDEYKYKKLTDQCRQIELALNQYNQGLMDKEKANKAKIERWDKKVHKILQKISKQRRDAEKSINSTLENYLIELSSAKSKSDSTCKFAFRNFQQLEQEIDALEASIDNEANVNRQIIQKINKHFSLQIQEISDLIDQERRNSLSQEKKVFDRLESMYKKLHESIEREKEVRQSKEEEAIQFLEKVIEKVKEQIGKQ